jgi:hypothetical protein
MKRRLLYILLVCSLVFPIGAQKTSDAELQDTIKRAAEGWARYLETFRDLISDERRSFEVYRENGSVRRRRTVESTFIVYRLSTDDSRIVEFRHITAVDGKKQGRADRRSQEFFEQLTKASSSAEELGRIRKESFRHDEIEIEGYTLNQGVPLSEKLKEVIEFKFVKNEIVDGKEVIIVDYQQTRPSADIRISTSSDKQEKSGLVDVDIDTAITQPLEPRMRGRLWLDKKTYQIRREVRELTAQPEGFTEPLVVLRADFSYKESDYGILTPSQIIVEFYKLQPKRQKATLDVRTVMEYSRFTNPDVEVRSAEVK